MKTLSTCPPKPRGRPRAFDRDKALDAAMRLFWQQGYEATSLSDLTCAMGINPPSLYSAFGDKEQLFLAAIEHYLNDGPGTSLSCLLSYGTTAREAIQKVLTNAANELANPDHPPGCMVVTSATNCSVGSARVQEAVARYRARKEEEIIARIEKGKVDGDLPAATDAVALARFYGTVMQGMTMQARDGATADVLLDIAMAAMRAWPSS
ncbi:TetR/AcrR family transcriptional regulator [Pokkaliibacter sp. MBI-7]|uniref:TetR/AcrR family transcriptional regulator n=1 Tax=Pokkaliibacter sp. MBI-7 TaxID=3040600 RepID=UPI00244C68A8|nr:TetR/AcrR family transcriptional regulator [Pokkaliibacter sp. MBI-7]MDH2435053.1 TetR/AcrR family transcriptional regulator [Pokkaliibacter sp. MBI-7]